MTGASLPLVADVRRALSAVADPAKAAPMQAYMKSAMPFHGVPKPARTAALRPVFRTHVLGDRGSWEATVRLLWDGAEYREERYAATDLARHRTYAAWATDVRSIALDDHLIVTGAWWDHGDEVAIRLVGPLLSAHPAQIDRVVRGWSRDEDRWRRRAAVICQIGCRDRTDTALLAECILANADDPDFFLRKGIGWALREHAKTDPDWVRAFVATYRGLLSPLSTREATRTLPPHPDARVAE
jgi:3-methyladenine DNA glycosylase AlkD